MTVQEKVQILIQLGEYLQKKDERLYAFLHRTAHQHKWFTVEQQYQAIDLVCEHLLDKNKLKNWVSKLDISKNDMPKKIGIIPKSTTPLAAWEAMMSCFLFGHISVVKLTTDNSFLLPFLIKKMEENFGGVKEYFEFPSQLPLKQLDGLIASVPSNMATHLKRYFAQQATCIQHPKQSIAVIHGDETATDFRLLCKDVLTFFGRDERNVSKLYVPKGYDFNVFLETFHEENQIIRHDPYKNNYDYQISLLILNRTLHWNNGSIILAEQQHLDSPISVLNFESYESEEQLNIMLQKEKNSIINILSQKDIHGFNTVPFGMSLRPVLFDDETSDFLAFFNQL